MHWFYAYTSDEGWHLYKYYTPENCSPIGFDYGVNVQVNVATGSGPWTGRFNNIVGNVGPYKWQLLLFAAWYRELEGVSGGAGYGRPMVLDKLIRTMSASSRG